MTENPVFQAIFGRRSIRRYTEEPVTREHLAVILEAGRWAPSGLNNQPWRFLALARGRDDERLAALEGCTKYAHILRGAGAVVLVFLDRARTYHEMKDHQSIGACLQNMLLGAHALGLGGVWLGEIVNQSSRVLELLGLDGEAYEFQAALAFGHPAQEGSSSRLPLEDLLLEPLPE